MAYRIEHLQQFFRRFAVYNAQIFQKDFIFAFQRDLLAVVSAAIQTQRTHMNI